MKPGRIAFVALALAVASGVANAQQPTPPRMGHPAAGKEQCLTCHARTDSANVAVTRVPASHNFPVTACAMCHQPPEHAPPAIPHATTEAFAQCKTCHVANSPMGAPAPPASHANYAITICAMCHSPRAS